MKKKDFLKLIKRLKIINRLIAINVIEQLSIKHSHPSNTIGWLKESIKKDL